MAKIIKILVIAVAILAGIIIWVKNPGDIRTRILGAKARVTRKTKAMIKDTKPTPESIEKAKQCRSMLKRIQSAKRAAQQRKGTGVDVTWKEVLPYLKMKEIPRCPAGGTYRLNTELVVPSCSISTNRTVDTADDHILLN